jgi:hypothetical protein
MSTDRRRFYPIEVRQRGANLYVLTIDGAVWCEIEWSASRRAWCIQDAAGHCLTHVEHIHATVADPQEAVRLARRMILDGRMPTPEEAAQQLAGSAAQGALEDAAPSKGKNKDEREDRLYEPARAPPARRP